MAEFIQGKYAVLLVFCDSALIGLVWLMLSSFGSREVNRFDSRFRLRRDIPRFLVKSTKLSVPWPTSRTSESGGRLRLIDSGKTGFVIFLCSFVTTVVSGLMLSTTVVDLRNNGYQPPMSKSDFMKGTSFLSLGCCTINMNLRRHVNHPPLFDLLCSTVAKVEVLSLHPTWYYYSLFRESCATRNVAHSFLRTALYVHL